MKTEDSGARGRLWPPLLAVASMATLPYLDFVVGNHDQGLDVTTVIAWWLVTLGVSIAVLLGLGRGEPRRTTRVATVVAPVLWWLFHFPLARELGPGAPRWVWSGIAVFLVALLVLGSRVRLVRLQVAVIAPILLLATAVQLLPLAANPSALADDGGTWGVPASGGAGNLQDGPNVWVFVADGYTSPDAVEALTGRQVDDFVAGLEDRGFVVADEARANYPVTHVSLASMLEMSYPVDEHDQVRSREPFYDRLRGDNATVDAFRSSGYAYVHAQAGGWEGSACSGREDLCIAPPSVASETSLGLAAMTPVGELLAPPGYHNVAQYSDPGVVVDRVQQAAPAEPYFVFSHLLGTHPPFLRHADCGFRRGVEIAELGDPGVPDGYGDAVACANRQFTAAVDRILERDPDAVVVIQGDHGAHLQARAYDAAPWPDDRYQVLSALRVPSGCRNQVPEDLAIVNVMRVVLACLEGTPADLLDHRSYHVGYRRPDVTTR